MGDSPAHGTAAWCLLPERVLNTPHSQRGSRRHALAQANGKLPVTLGTAVLADAGD